MTDEARAELAAHQKDFGRLKARVDYSLKRGEERIRAAMSGQPIPPPNPMELSDAEWDYVGAYVDAWDAVLTRKAR